MNQLFAGCFVCVLGVSLFAQQIDSVDLTRPPALLKASTAQALPDGCEKLSEGGIADGIREPEDHRPRRIVIEVVSTKEIKPELGSEVEAVVRLQNTDTKPIVIPWSTDPSVVEEGQKENDFEWQIATFEFTLTDQKGNHVALKSLTEWLRGSKFSPGSLLTIQPGQNITAIVKFKLVELYPIEPLVLKAGDWKLSAAWHQMGRTWHTKNCAIWNGFFHYGDFYKQKNPSVAIQISEPKSANQE
jgi:hypothetical protein